jgi:hypothetical protein
LSFDENPVESGDFWGLRWAGTNGYAVLTNAVATGMITLANNLTGSYSSGTLVVYRKADNSYTYVGLNMAPSIDQGTTISTSMNEDGGTKSLTDLVLTAVDDGAGAYGVTWTNVTTPTNGTVSVNGSGTNPVIWTSFAYTLTNANWNGTDSFVVQATDALGASNRITVSVVVDPVNDAPTNTAAPTVIGVHQQNQTITNDFLGSWSDTTDTDLGGSSSLTQTRQWQLATNAAGDNFESILDATNETYALTDVETGKWIRVAVTCTDTGVGSGGNQSSTAYSDWDLVTIPNVLPVILNGAAGPLVVNVTEDCGETNLLEVLGLNASDGDSGQQDLLEWTNRTTSAYAVLTVTGTASSNPASITYTPVTNWNGTNTFTVRVTDPVGGYDEINVEIRVAAINDAPVMSTRPTVSGIVKVDRVLTVVDGTWSDTSDTNVRGTSTLTLGHQWRVADNASGDGVADLSGETGSTLTLTLDHTNKYVSVAETCTNTGVGDPEVTLTTTNSVWYGPVLAADMVYVAVRSGLFNDPATWGQAVNWPQSAGDTAVVDNAYIVTNTLTASEVPNGVVVNLSNGGTLKLRSAASMLEPIDAGAIVNIASNGVLELNAFNTVKSMINLDGGTIKFASGTQTSVIISNTVNVNKDSVILYSTTVANFSPTLHGAAKLTVTSTVAMGTVNRFGMRSDSTWDGVLDLSQSGHVRGDTLGLSLARTIRGNTRLGLNAVFNQWSYSTTGWTGIPGILRGNGILTGYASGSDWTVSGTGNMSPGDTAGQAGTLTVAANYGQAAGNYNCLLSFASGAQYTVDITGQTSGDKIVVAGHGTGTGNVTIASGAILTVNLWTPEEKYAMDMVVIDASGTISGNFTTINWNNTNDWQNLEAVVEGNDLHIKGSAHPRKGSLYRFR